jgi:hypothetical protein
MKRIIVALLFVVASLAFASDASAQTCQPYGSGGLYGPYSPNGFNYVANGGPANGACWSIFNATIDTMTCGFSNTNTFEFNYAGDVAQSFTIPATDTSRSHYSLVYLFEFTDPNHDPAFTQFSIEVRDETTHSTLLTDYYNGSQPDLFCVRREPAAITGNLAGHTITIRMMGTRGSDAAHVRAFGIQFWGY